MESLSIWSLAGVVLNSAVITAVRLSTQRVWHTFNYDITISNGVNLCHPGPSWCVSAYEISKSTGFHVDFGFQNGFLDFKMDFWISKWISGFQSGFLDFKVDFWISSEFLDFKADFWISFELLLF